MAKNKETGRMALTLKEIELPARAKTFLEWMDFPSDARVSDVALKLQSMTDNEILAYPNCGKGTLQILRMEFGAQKTIAEESISASDRGMLRYLIKKYDRAALLAEFDSISLDNKKRPSFADRMGAEVKAKDGCCEECAMGAPFYIPCNRPAVCLIGWPERKEGPYRMCEMCADHSVKNRSASRYPLSGVPAAKGAAP